MSWLSRLPARPQLQQSGKQLLAMRGDSVSLRTQISWALHMPGRKGIKFAMPVVSWQ